MIYLKKLSKILISIIVLLPVILYGSIVIANNCIADKIEQRLVKYDLPENTVLIDSISIAGKLTGNGNGMQYMGSILVESDFSQDELEKYYSSDFDYIEVIKQDSASIDFIHPRNYSFKEFQQEDGKTYYSITCWDGERNRIFSDLLDFDIRGH